MTGYVIQFADASKRAVVGGKAFGLHLLTSWGLNVPPGFVVTTNAYDRAIESLGIDLSNIEIDAAQVANGLLSAPIDDDLESQVARALGHLEEQHGADMAVSCRSSATAEDSATASFAGQFATVLGVRGMEGIADGLKRCWASAWSVEAVSYRATNGIGHEEVSMAVVVQKMVNARSAGVVFSVNPVTGDSTEVMINSSWGLGEAVVSGLVTPDTYLVSKSDRSVSVREVSQSKNVSHVVAADGSIEEVAVDPFEAMSPSITDEQIAELTELAIAAEARAGSPQDIEWAYEDDRLYVLQTRPVTTT